MTEHSDEKHLEKTLLPWLKGKDFATAKADFDRDGYIIFESVLGSEELAAIRDGLSPHFEKKLARAQQLRRV